MYHLLVILVKSPFRISLFGGSTDYESFYKDHGSLIIGSTINQYAYLSIRDRPTILSPESWIVYSKYEIVKNHKDIQNPLIRAILTYYNVDKHIECFSFSDIPSRTGLGGSSSYCAGLIYLIAKWRDIVLSKKQLALDAINIERKILNESGGIQDQIWAAYGGFNSIEIAKNGDFFVKPMPITLEFKKEFENSLVLIYTNDQREQDTIAKSHETQNHKLRIKEIAENAYRCFEKEDIAGIGGLLKASWQEKRQISTLVSTPKIDNIVDRVLSLGAYGAKLLGSGGCGFILAICDKNSKKKILEEFGLDILHFKLENHGTTEAYRNIN